MVRDRVFFMDAQLELEDFDPGKISRKVRAMGGSLMLVEAIYKAGGIGSEHEHPHEQICYCVSGEFMYLIGSESRTLVAGDSVYVPSGTRHGAVCIKDGSLLDVFTPHREDLIRK
jgi:quercetin dioxygenase-like cupin family protein